MDLPTYFTDFMRNISPTQDDITEYRDEHTKLTELLKQDEGLRPALVSTFLQGSYRRATLLKPLPDTNADVDVVVVTKLNKDEYTPDLAIKTFVPFLDEHYPRSFRIQGRSIGIHLSNVDIDLVVTAAPSQSQIGVLQSEAVTSPDTAEDVRDWRPVPSWISLSQRNTPQAQVLLKAAQTEEEWKLEPLNIPDRERAIWERTHPLEQIRWTHEKNRFTNGHYIHVVKSIKWWRRVKQPESKHPKSYPLEHLIGLCCPNRVSSVAEGVTLTLEAIARDYQSYAAMLTTPTLPDHGVPEHNVFQRVSGAYFATFHSQVTEASKIARKALDSETVAASASAWRDLFDGEFPEPSDTGTGGPDKGGYTPRAAPTVIAGGRFA